MFGLSGRALRVFCGTLLVGIGFMAVAGIAMVLDQTRPVQGTTKVILSVGLIGVCTLGAIAFSIPALTAAYGLHRDARTPGARSTLASSAGLALMAGTLGVISIIGTTGPALRPIRVPDALLVPLVAGVILWLGGAFLRDPKP